MVEEIFLHRNAARKWHETYTILTGRKTRRYLGEVHHASGHSEVRFPTRGQYEFLLTHAQKDRNGKPTENFAEAVQRTANEIAEGAGEYSGDSTGGWVWYVKARFRPRGIGPVPFDRIEFRLARKLPALA